MNDLRRIGLGFVVLGLAACATLAPGAEKVLVTEKAADVAGCNVVGEVVADRPVTSVADMNNKLRNAALAIGGNVVFKTSGSLWINLAWKGIAYQCGARPPG